MPRLSTMCSRALAAVFAATLFFAVAVPHVHADASHSHHTQACRACKLHEGFSATPPVLSTSLASTAPPARAHTPAVDAPRTVRLTPYAPPRAPPALS